MVSPALGSGLRHCVEFSWQAEVLEFPHGLRLTREYVTIEFY